MNRQHQPTPLELATCDKRPVQEWTEAIKKLVPRIYEHDPETARKLELTIERTAGRKMPLRRYAIGYLGNRQCSVAVPVLLSIASNEEEEDYFRADAVKALAQIEPSKGRSVAEAFSARTDFRGERSRSVMAGEQVGLSRTYLQAIRGVHE